MVSMCQLTHEIFQSIAKFVDSSHSRGRSVTARKVRAHIYEKFGGLEVHRTTMIRALKRMGLTWSPIAKAKRTFASYRTKEIKKYLLGLDYYLKEMENVNLNYIFVFMDESYINVNHRTKYSFLPDDKEQDSKLTRKSSKGKRLIILHTITKDGPLVELDEDGIPISDLRVRLHSY